MNSNDIEKILSNLMKQFFRGVYPSDARFPHQAPYPFGFVVNTDPYGSIGKHWQAIWVVNNNNVEFFDSFGDEPKGNVKSFLNKFTKNIKNTKKIQSNNEISCGPFVMYYLLQRTLGTPFQNIINTLRKYPYKDSFVKLFVYNLIS